MVRWPGSGGARRTCSTSPAILACCVAIIAVSGLGSPLFSYLAVYGESVYGVDGAQLGLLFGAAGIGSVLFTPLLLSVAPRLPRARLLGAAMLLYGVSVAAMGLAPTYAWSIVALLCFGGAYLSIASTINTTIQLVVLEELRGRGHRDLPDVPDRSAAGRAHHVGCRSGPVGDPGDDGRCGCCPGDGDHRVRRDRAVRRDGRRR